MLTKSILVYRHSNKMAQNHQNRIHLFSWASSWGLPSNKNAIQMNAVWWKFKAEMHTEKRFYLDRLLALSLSDARCDAIQVKSERDGPIFAAFSAQFANIATVDERMRQQTEPIWVAVRCAFYKLANLSFSLKFQQRRLCINIVAHMSLIGRIDVRINRKISSPWPSRAHRLQFCDTQKLLIKQSHSITRSPSFVLLFFYFVLRLPPFQYQGWLIRFYCDL